MGRVFNVVMRIVSPSDVAEGDFFRHTAAMIYRQPISPTAARRRGQISFGLAAMLASTDGRDRWI